MRLNILIIFIGLAQLVSAQTLSYGDFMDQIAEHHPVMRQSQIITEMGQSDIQASRGFFDPEVKSGLAQKYLEGHRYYTRGGVGMEVPTWFGVELEAGFKENGGEFINPEDYTSGGGIWYGGISVPLGKDLFIDKRRAELRKAQAMQGFNVANARITQLDVLFKGALTYWKWYEARAKLDVYEYGYTLAQDRLVAIQSEAEAGDRPFIDTLEAGIYAQNRLAMLVNSQREFINAQLELEMFLWGDGLIPLTLPEGTVPSELSIEDLNAELPPGLDSLVANHPIIMGADAKIAALEVEQDYRREQLKPKLDLEYNPLSGVVDDVFAPEFSAENYTWGASFAMPIFLRGERGKLRKAQLQSEDAVIKRSIQQNKLQIQIQQSINDMQQFDQQARTLSRVSQDYEQLVQGEIQLFEAGESSLFLVNSREIGFIKAEINRIKAFAENRKAESRVRFVAGNL